ncbi:hypothetical protein V5799_025869 [Amblyomma americanum]|uniref:Uncharacterized protein n=1 Tax=Amblyomma americanum TaxID=6943 RepID=A0AAQ4E8A1_AMBAM
MRSSECYWYYYAPIGAVSQQSPETRSLQVSSGRGSSRTAVDHVALPAVPEGLTITQGPSAAQGSRENLRVRDVPDEDD